MDLDRLSQLLASPDPSARASAANAAAESGNPAAIRPLSARLRSEPEARVRNALLTALARLGTPEGLAAIRGQAGDPDPKNRCRVLEALYRAQDQQVFPLAIRLLSDLDSEVKSMAFQIVKKLGRDGIMQIIGKMLSADDVRWKVYAVAALGQIASAEGVAVLARCLTHATPEVRLQARASLVNLAKHGNDSASRALTTHEGTAPAADPNSTLVSPPLSSLRPPQQATGSLNETLMVPPPGMRTGPASRPPLSSPGAGGPSSLKGPRASELAGPPPLGGSPSASTIAKRPSVPGGVQKPAFVPLDEDSLKIRPKDTPDKPPQRRYSTAKYKALFGESMPRMVVPPPPEPEPVVEDEAQLAEDEGLAAEAPDQPPRELTAEEEQKRKKASKHWKDNICRDCVHIKSQRPDKEKMAQGRGWCSLVKKEVKFTYSCPRGKW